MRESEEMSEHGRPVHAKAQKELRSNTATTNDSPDSIRQAGGEDPRRHAFHPIMERKIRDHDESGFNHNGVISNPESALGNNEHMRKMQSRAMGMGTPNPDGTYSR
jgi:hypothetical protein